MNYPDYYNAATGLLESVDTPDAVAFRQGDSSLSYRQLADSASRMGGMLLDQGFAVEDRVAMVVHDTLDFPVIFLGSIRAGVIPIPLNTLLTAEQYRYILADSGADGLFVSAALLPVIEPVLAELPELKRIYVCGGEPGEHIEFTAALARADTTPAVVTHRDSTAFWLYSSGSTGMPKGVRHVHSSMMDTANFYGQQVLGMTSSDVAYSAAKLFFAYGLGNALSFPLCVGATTILDAGRPTPTTVQANLHRYQPTIFFGAPTLFAAMLADPDCIPENGSQRLRLCVSAGEALPADIGVRWKERFGVDIVDGVGSTEMLHIFLSNTPQNIHYGASGVAVPGYKVRLVDEQDNSVADDEIGELLVKGDSAADGYWNQRIKSRQTFIGEWTRTGDKYTRDAAGIYTYAGRTDDMFKVSGQWVSPFEVESALIAHPMVVEAAVVPAEDNDGLVKPKAYVILTQEGGPASASGCDTENTFEILKTHVQELIGKWKYPRWIVVVDELPKTATGKIQRYKLRDAG